MEKKTVKLILMLIASAAISFIFYLQGAKIEEKDAEIAQAKEQSFENALNYKDSIIQFLRDSIHSVKGIQVVAPTPSPNPVIINNIPPQQGVNKTPIPGELYNSISRLMDSTGQYLSRFKPTNQITSVQPSSSDSSLLIKLKKIYNDTLNSKLNILCNNAFGVDSTGSRGKKPQTLNIIKSLASEIVSDLEKNERFISDAINILLTENKSTTDKSNKNDTSMDYAMYKDDPLRQKLQNLNQYLQNTGSKGNSATLDTLLKDICAIKNGYYFYFK